MTPEQIKTLEELGFKLVGTGWRKDYRDNSYIIIPYSRWITIKHIEDIDEAISDFAVLREKGIV